MTPPVARRGWFVRLARAYARRRIRVALDGLHVAGLTEARALAAAQPILLAANHVAWWDPLLLLPLDGALGTEGYALMDAANLARLPFFGWLGAIPLERERSAGSRRGLQQAAGLLSAPGRALWIFPQGRQRPSWVRPLGLKPGLRLLVRLAEAPVVPVALTYGFREHERPAAVVRFGAPLPREVARGSDLIPALEAQLCADLERNDRFLEGEGAADYTALIAPPAAARQDGLGARLLAAWGQRTDPRTGGGDAP